MDYTLGKEQVHNTYHITSIRGGLTRSLDRCFPELRDEIEHAFDDVLALKGNGEYLSSFISQPPIQPRRPQNGNIFKSMTPFCIL